jgi:ribosomal protein L11 methyltransferase
MSWLELTIELTGRDPGPLEDALNACGAQAITLTDAGDQPLLEPGVGEMPLWKDVVVRALFGTDADRAAVDAAVAGVLAEHGTRSWQTLADRAWEREWLANFKARRYGERVWVIPTGSEIVDPDAANVLLDPGLAFGTGDHETTALCLAWLGNHAGLRDARVLDYGCGSGILAIAALRLGARHAVAVDNDPQALQATRDNALRNEVASRIDIRPPDPPLRETFDIVLANILAGPLVQLAPRLVACVAPGGALVLSGLLAGQADDVRTAYADSIDWTESAQRGDWLRLDGTRRSAG